MSKKNRKNLWRKLDNTAKIFSLNFKNNTNIFRYSVILKQNVDEKILLFALKKSLENYKSFKVKFGTGLFWNYFEYNPKDVILEKETGIPCERIDFKENNDYLFKVTYYKKKINLDVFHALTDGTGALGFFKSIIYNYLSLKHDIRFIEKENDYKIDYEDQYIKNYNKYLKVESDIKKAFQIPGKIDKNINNTYHYIVDIKEIKQVCKKYKVSITEYLTAIYIYAMYLSIYNKESKKEIVIEVPINLRNYYGVDTLSNFFVCMKINSKIKSEKVVTLNKILKQVHKEFSKKLTVDKVKGYLTRDVKLGTNISIRLVPLFIKKLFINFMGHLVSSSSTSTLSNIGIVDIDDRFTQYINNILIMVIPGNAQKIKCTICSFNKKLNVSMNSNIDDIKFEQTFYKLLNKEISKIKLESNNDINQIRKR